MNNTVKIAIEPLGAGAAPDSNSDIVNAPLQQREAMIDRVCQAILSKAGSLRAGEPG